LEANLLEASLHPEIKHEALNAFEPLLMETWQQRPVDLLLHEWALLVECVNTELEALVERMQ